MRISPRRNPRSYARRTMRRLARRHRLDGLALVMVKGDLVETLVGFDDQALSRHDLVANAESSLRQQHDAYHSDVSDLTALMDALMSAPRKQG